MEEERKELIDVVSLAGSLIGEVLDEIKDDEDGYNQACLLAALLETFKSTGVINPLVDMAVSYKGRVLRTKKEADDYCE